MSTVVTDQTEACSRQKELARRHAERQFAQMVSEASFEQITTWAASNNEYASIAISQLFGHVSTMLERRATRICSRIGHLGRLTECGCRDCDRAWQSAYHVLVERAFGLPPANPDSRQHFPDQPPRSTGTAFKPRSALGAQPKTLDDWINAVKKVINFSGVETDCLRAWNTDRGLVVRIDQKSYVVREGKQTDLASRIIEEWHQKLDAMSFNLVPPELTEDDLLAFLRAIYSDACQWGYQGETITRRRARSTYLNPDALSPLWRAWLEDVYKLPDGNGDDSVFKCLTTFVEALERACYRTPEGRTLERPLHPVYDSITDAWDQTRHEPVGVVVDISALENLVYPDEDL